MEDNNNKQDFSDSLNQKEKSRTNEDTNNEKAHVNLAKKPPRYIQVHSAPKLPHISTINTDRITSL